MTKRDVIVHVHIFKNAGSSFDSSLRENFGNKFVDHRDDKDIIKGQQDYLENYLNQNKEIVAFSSHSIYFEPKDTNNYNFHPVYFLRHPIERIRSVYSFEKKQEPAVTKGAKKAKELLFNDYVKWYMDVTSPATIRNLQTIFLAGLGNGPKNIEKKFLEAQNNILKHSSLVGVVDRYDESIVVLEEALRTDFPNLDLSYIRRNVTDTDLTSTVEIKAKKLLDSLDHETQKLVVANNKYDMELYEKANILLDQKIAKIRNFETRLNNFKDRCMVKQLSQLSHKKAYAEVLSLAKNRIENGTSNPSIYLIAIEAFITEKKLKDAIQLCDQAIEKFSKNPWPYFAKVEALQLNGNDMQAKDLFETVSKKFEDEQHIVKQYAKKLGL